jgi:hypothetical protein
MITLPFADKSAVTDCVMFAPRIPMEVIATTPMTIPMAASRLLKKWSLTFLTESSKKISSRIIIEPLLYNLSVREENLVVWHTPPSLRRALP